MSAPRDTRYLSRGQSSLRFSARELLLLIVAIGMLLGWWADRRRSELRMEIAAWQQRQQRQMQGYQVTRNPGGAASAAPDRPSPNPFTDPEGMVGLGRLLLLIVAAGLALAWCAARTHRLMKPMGSRFGRHGVQAARGASTTLPHLGLRECFLLFVLVGVALAWFVDHRRVAAEIAALRGSPWRQSDSQSRPAAATRDEANTIYVRDEPSPFATPAELVAFLRQLPDVEIDHFSGSSATQIHITPLIRMDSWGDLVRALSRTKSKPLAQESVPMIVPLLNDPDETVRARAAIALGYFGARPDVVVPELIELLDHPTSLVRSIAADALVQFEADAKPAIPALEKFLMDDDSDWAATAGAYMRRIDPDVDLGDRYKQLLTNNNRRVRILAVRELHYHLSAGETERVLTSAFARETDPVVRDAIAKALTRYN